MICHYTPCHSRHRARWSQPAIDVLACEWRGQYYEVDFSDPGVEYEIPEEARDVIHRAWRDTETGPLHVQVPSLNNLKTEVTVDYGTQYDVTLDSVVVDRENVKFQGELPSKEELLNDMESLKQQKEFALFSAVMKGMGGQ